MKGNIVFGTIIVLFSIAAYTQTTDLPPQSALFPKVILWAMGITGLLMILDAVVKGRKGKEESGTSIPRRDLIYQILIPGGIMLGAYILLRLFGFFITSFILVAFLFYYQTYKSYGTKLSLRHGAKGLIFSASVTAVMFVIFSLLLGLPTPSGMLL